MTKKGSMIIHVMYIYIFVHFLFEMFSVTKLPKILKASCLGYRVF